MGSAEEGTVTTRATGTTQLPDYRTTGVTVTTGAAMATGAAMTIAATKGQDT